MWRGGSRLRARIGAYALALAAAAALPAPSRAQAAPTPDPHACAPVKIDPARLTLEAALRQALCKEPRIDAAIAKVAAERARRGAARSSYYPSVSAGAQRTYTHTKTVGLFGGSSDAIGNTASLQWSLLLIDFGGRAAQNRAAAGLVQAAIAAKDATLLAVFSNVLASYVSIMRFDQLIEAAGEAERNARRAVDFARKQADLGALASFEIKSAEASYAQARLTRIRAQTQRWTSNAELATLVGLAANTQLKLSITKIDLGEAERLLRNGAPAVEAALQRIQSSHPSIASAMQRLAAAAEQGKAARSAFFPTLSVNGQYYLNGRPQTTPTTTGGREHVVTVGLNVPIFDGFATTYKTRETAAMEADALAEVDRARAFVQLEVWKAFGAAMQQVEVVQTSNMLVSAAKDALDAAEVRLGGGGIDTTEWLRAQRSFFDARAESINARAELLLNKAGLLTALGALDVDTIAGQRPAQPPSSARRKPDAPEKRAAPPAAHVLRAATPPPGP